VINPRLSLVTLLSAAIITFPLVVRGGASDKGRKPEFHTSDRCAACHNELKTSSGEDISIGFQWRASIMANSARDPYWQGSVRRESIDHPESQAAIEDECSTCHMPITHLTAKADNRKAEVFAHLPLSSAEKGVPEAADGVSCSVCHQVQKTGLGTDATFNGNVVVAGANDENERPEFGPFAIDAGHQRIMHSSTGGFMPEQADHIRDSALCGSCHTLKTKALGANGQEIGSLPEQMPYQEWLHSSYKDNVSCQSCHMPEVKEAVAITSLYGQPREGMHRHEFLGGNFFMTGLFNTHRDELAVKALPQELTVVAQRTEEFLKTQSARLTIRDVQPTARGLAIEILVENLTGHKFPTAYPSRRAWLHVTVRDNNGRAVFESGKLNPDGSIVGNDNDADALRYEPYYREITNADQVEIFEPILKDANGRVTTGLLSAIGYLKDSRILPHGFDKSTAEADISVVGAAASDPDFTDEGAAVRYVVDTANASGPFHIEVELWYQPIGFRWAHNLGGYKAMEPQRFVGYYQAASKSTALLLATANAETK
jgi:hypothetical protein